MNSNRKFQHEFIVDKESKVIRFADKSFSQFDVLKSVSSVVSMFGIYGSDKQRYKQFYQQYGITPTHFKKCYNAIMKELWIVPVEKHVKRYAFGCNRKLQPAIVDKIWEAKNIIDQCEKDGVENIIPLVIAFGEDTASLKERFGKGAWKRITKQSMTRNSYIARRGDMIKDISLILDWPSYILKKGGTSGIQWNESGKWIIDQGLYPKSTVTYNYPQMRDMSRHMHLFQDTECMARELGKGFSAKWGVEKMQQKHDEYTKLIMLKRYSPNVCKCLEDFKHKTFEHEGLTATLCDSPLSVHEEGQIMHHCVGSYASSVDAGNYLVYSIKKDGVRLSTLGLRKKGNLWRYDQHYGYCNSHVQDENANVLVTNIIEKINSDYWKEKADAVALNTLNEEDCW